MNIPLKAQQIMRLLKDTMRAQEVLIVGGFVRDSLLGIESKDIDIEVFGLDMDAIESALADSGFRVDAVGKSFGVLKIDNEIDISIPRRDNKVGAGHRGFSVEVDPDMSIEEAARRRDFTINSMSMDVDGNIIDPFNGREHLSLQLLVPTDPATFVEDPLRVMRAMQFASRCFIDLSADAERLCRDMASLKNELPKERIWEEWRKWALKGQYPFAGLDVLMLTNWADPEIEALVGVQQEEEWHPEGDVFIHTKHVVNAAARIAEREQLEDKERMILMFAALCHDFGKPSTTEFIDGRWRARGHSQAGVEPTRNFLERIGAPLWLIEHVIPLVQEHLTHAGNDYPSNRAVRRLANRLAPASIEMLSLLVEADHSGRPPLPKGNPFLPWLTAAIYLDVYNSKPSPILMGRHLKDLGVKPGPEMGQILNKAFEAQLDGEFNNLGEGIQWVHIKYGY